MSYELREVTFVAFIDESDSEPAALFQTEIDITPFQWL